MACDDSRRGRELDDGSGGGDDDEEEEEEEVSMETVNVCERSHVEKARQATRDSGHVTCTPLKHVVHTRTPPSLAAAGCSKAAERESTNKRIEYAGGKHEHSVVF